MVPFRVYVCLVIKINMFDSQFAKTNLLFGIPQFLRTPHRMYSLSPGTSFRYSNGRAVILLPRLPVPGIYNLTLPTTVAPGSGYRMSLLLSHEPSPQPQPSEEAAAASAVTFVVAVIAKQPKPGHSKTRLQPLFASSSSSSSLSVSQPPPTTTPTTTSHNHPQQQQEKEEEEQTGPSQLAKAMLCDVLASISHCCHQARRRANSQQQQVTMIIDQLLFYAPPTPEAREQMQHIVASTGTTHRTTTTTTTTTHPHHHIPEDWTLLPIHRQPPRTTATTTTSGTATGSSSSTDYDCHNHDLSSILSHVVRTGRNRHSSTPNTTVILFGMDAPEIPMEELFSILTTTTTTRHEAAFLCPAYDGGYVMLSIPPVVPSETMDSIFQSVSPYWSHPLTAVTQLKAFSDAGIPCIIGPVVHDIDTPDDVAALVQRLQSPPRRHSVPRHDNSTSNHNNHDHDTTTGGMDDVNHHGCCLSRPSLALCPTTTTTIFQDYVHCPYTRQALIDLKLF